MYIICGKLVHSSFCEIAGSETQSSKAMGSHLVKPTNYQPMAIETLPNQSSQQNAGGLDQCIYNKQGSFGRIVIIS